MVEESSGELRKESLRLPTLVLLLESCQAKQQARDKPRMVAQVLIALIELPNTYNASFLQEYRFRMYLSASFYRRDSFYVGDRLR